MKAIALSLISLSVLAGVGFALKSPPADTAPPDTHRVATSAIVEVAPLPPAKPVASAPARASIASVAAPVKPVRSLAEELVEMRRKSDTEIAQFKAKMEADSARFKAEIASLQNRSRADAMESLKRIESADKQDRARFEAEGARFAAGAAAMHQPVAAQTAPPPKPATPRGPSVDELQHRQVMRELDAVRAEQAALRDEIAAADASKTHQAVHEAAQRRMEERSEEIKKDMDRTRLPMPGRR